MQFELNWMSSQLDCSIDGTEWMGRTQYRRATGLTLNRVDHLQ